MSGTPQDVLDIARSQLGVDSGRKYFEEMGDAWWGQAWCARFGRWVYWKAGVDCHWPYDVAFDERDVPRKYRVDKYDLQPAYPLCFDWDADHKGDHFGIVESVQDWGCVTLEGNAGNPGKVRREQRVWDNIICGIKPTFAEGKGRWVKAGERWWWEYPDGTWPASRWLEIDGHWYYFDADGWMVTGWVQTDGKWYWCDKTKGHTEGQMLTSTCVQDGGSWYALGADGAMLTGSIKTNTAHDGRFGALEL